MSGYGQRPASAPNAGIPPQLLQAQQYLRANNPAEAEKLCRTALAADGSQPAALQLLALILVNRGERNEAEQLLRRCIAAAPRAASAHVNLGNLLLLKSDHQGAESAYRAALALNARHAEAQFNLGLALKAQGRTAESLEALRRATDIRPDYFDALVQSATLHLEMGAPEDALSPLARAVALRPDSYEAHYNRGLALVRTGHMEEAMQSLARAAQLNEASPDVFLALGHVLHHLQRRQPAISALARAAALKPDCAEAHAALAAAFHVDGWTNAALDEAQKALALDAAAPYHHMVYGRILSDLNRLDEAIAAHEKAVALDAGCLEAWISLGNAYLSMGRSEEALAALEHAKTLSPRHVRTHFEMARTAKFVQDDPRLADLLALEADEASLQTNDRAQLHYALGKAYDDLDDPDRAFAHFDKANKLLGSHAAANEDSQAAHNQRIIDVFTGDFVRSREGGGSDSCLPIFILGMPRSGTTLVEQVLSSHPRVKGAGEVLDLEVAIQFLCNKYKLTTPMPDLVTGLTPEQMCELGDVYAGRLTERAPGADRVTDKLLGNYNRIGLIHLALPQAKVIHCMRNPADCCVSIYTNHFAEHLDHVNDLARLGRFYGRYHRLMAHWRGVLPEGAFLDVRYEDTVRDLEAAARRIIAYCGLEWDERCLDFQRNRRAVMTLSITQVRQPVYTSSIGRWRKYEKHLGPLLEALGELELPA